MSMIDDLAAMAGNAGGYSRIVSLVEQAIASGERGDSPMGKRIADEVKRLIPDLQGGPEMVHRLDDLIPDALQSRFGFTPPLMAFIKEALGAAPRRSAPPRR